MTAEDPASAGDNPVGVALQLSVHTIARMAERGVTRSDIEVVLRNWDIRRPAEPIRGRKLSEIYIGNVGDRRLKVYVEIGSDPYYVTTVAWEGG